MAAEHDRLLGAIQDSEGGNEWQNSGRNRFDVYREKTAKVLDSRALHESVIALITIDATCVLIDVGYGFLFETCTPAEGPQAPAWLGILSRVSLVITTLFLIEIPIALWAFGTGYYNPFSGVPHAALHLFDASVILTTFVLDAILRGREREMAGLLIMLRLWRLVKLVGGVAVGAGEIEEETVRELERTRRKLGQTETALAHALKENAELRNELSAVKLASSSLSNI